MNSIRLHDMEDPIEYAQIKTSTLTDEVTKTRKEQSLEKGEINGMRSDVIKLYYVRDIVWL